MSITFSSKLVSCRHDKGVSQKAAAAEIGIAPALLSHYENGIRECKIDMLPKIAAYYGVTADYLVGCSESRHGAGELFNMDYCDGDENPSVKTVLRSIIGLSQNVGGPASETERFFCDFFSLCVKKYADAAAGVADVRSRFIGQTLEGLSPKQVNTEPYDIPVCEKTVIANANAVIDGVLADIVGKK